MPHLNINKIRKKVKKCLHQAQRVGPVTPLPIPTGPVGPIGPVGPVALVGPGTRHIGIFCI